MSLGIDGAPDDFMTTLGELPAGVVVAAEGLADVVVVFSKTATELRRRFDAAKERIPADGAIWVAWPKKASRVPTDLSFEVVQPHGLASGLVDNKVCAIDDTWSGLRFVVRREDRAAWPVRG